MTAALHQASCVAINGRGLVVEGPPGSGKSSLALALIDRGAALVGDDGLSLRADGRRLLASPAPAIAGLMEIRNVGLVEMPFVRDVPVALVIRLDPGAPRAVEAAQSIAFFGVQMPAVQLWPGSPVLALRAEWALRIHGSEG